MSMGCTPHDFVKLFLGGVHRLAYTNFMRSLTETAVKDFVSYFLFFFFNFLNLFSVTRTFI